MILARHIVELLTGALKALLNLAAGLLGVGMDVRSAMLLVASQEIVGVGVDVLSQVFTSILVKSDGDCR